MKKKVLSTSFGLLLTLGLLLPLNHSLVNVGNPSTVQVNVNGNSCIKILADGAKVNICGGGIDQLDVSWNSGGG